MNAEHNMRVIQPYKASFTRATKSQRLGPTGTQLGLQRVANASDSRQQVARVEHVQLLRLVARDQFAATWSLV